MRKKLRLIEKIVMFTSSVSFIGIICLFIWFFSSPDKLFIKKPIQVVKNNNVKAPDNLWKGLIGEAVSEGPEGMYAVACVYRNRLVNGIPLGCVALKRKDLDEFVAKQGKRYEITSKATIQRVFKENGSDITGGAIHYESTDFPVPEWEKDMTVTTKIGKHIFYKEK